MSLPPEELRDLLIKLEKQRTMLKEQIAEICYFMHGGVEWDSAWGMCFEDREILIKTVNRQLKAQNPTGKDYM